MSERLQGIEATGTRYIINVGYMNPGRRPLRLPESIIPRIRGRAYINWILFPSRNKKAFRQQVEFEQKKK